MKKIYLDRNLNVSEFFGNHRFTFFIGVNPGNTLLTLIQSKGRFSEKIVFVENSEITYEYPEIKNTSIRKLSLFKKNVMSNRLSTLSIDEKNIKLFNQPEAKIRKVGLNLYEFKLPFSEHGKREYLRLDSLGKSLYVGIGNIRKVIIPSNEFMDRVLSSFGLENLEKRCLVQVNLRNAPSGIFVDGDSSLGPIDLETKFLDREGIFETDVENLNELTNQIFILGDLQGVVNIRIDYINGQSDILETICSSDDYLVEQL